MKPLKKAATKKGANLLASAGNINSPSSTKVSDADIKLESDKIKEKLEKGDFSKYMNKSINTNFELKKFTKQKLVENVVEKDKGLKLNDITVGEGKESIKI